MRQIVTTAVLLVAAFTAFTVLGVHIVDHGGSTAELMVLGGIVTGVTQRLMRRQPPGRESPRLSE